jgi:hypothetical protein
MIEIAPCLDIDFRDVALVLLHRQDEVHLQNFLGDSPKSFQPICSKFSQRLGDFNVPTGDIDTHSNPRVPDVIRI